MICCLKMTSSVSCIRLKEEFKIICVSSCKHLVDSKTGKGFLGDEEIKKGEIFNTNYYEFNYAGTYARLFRNGKIIGLFEQKNFLKIEDYRNKTIDDLISNDR